MYELRVQDTSRKRRSSINMLEYDRIDISEGIDIKKQMHQMSVTFVIIGTLKILVLNINQIFVMV